jgi:uncharacterized protein
MENSRLEIRLKPRAKGDRIRFQSAGKLDIAVTSPPVDDRANEHLVRLIASRIGIAKSLIAIVKGRHSRNKVIVIYGMTTEGVMKKLRNAD